jgi:hypothetical protein
MVGGVSRSRTSGHGFAGKRTVAEPERSADHRYVTAQVVRRLSQSRDSGDVLAVLEAEAAATDAAAIDNFNDDDGLDRAPFSSVPIYDNLEGSVGSRDSKGGCRGAARDTIEAGLN